MSEEEKKAIDTLKEVASDDFDTLGDDISPKMAQSILNVINKQQKELDFYKKEELGYITGYEDGKRHKQTAVAIKNENAQQELFQKEIARLKEIIDKQQKEIYRLQNIKRKDIEDLINNEKENIYINYISKDKIREKIEESKEMITNEFVCETYKDRYEFLVKYLEELLEEK